MQKAFFFAPELFYSTLFFLFLRFNYVVPQSIDSFFFYYNAGILFNSAEGYLHCF